MGKISVIGLSGESIFMKVKNLPMPSVTTHAMMCHIEPGGKGYNQAVTSKKLGADVSYLTCVGNDDYGKKCEEYMKSLEIKTYFIKNSTNNTALATILTDESSENEVIVYPGASNELTPKDVEAFEEEIKKSDYLLIQFELPLEVLEKAVEIAKKCNTKIILNPAPVKYLDFKYLNEVDIITPNEEEARLLFNVPKNIKTSQLGGYLKGIIKNKLIITLGKKGALLVTNECYLYFDSINVKSIDTTGAGDVFNGSLAYYLSENKSLDEAINFAIIVSGISVTRPYVMNAIPTNNEICQFQKLYNCQRFMIFTKKKIFISLLKL